MPLMWWIFDPHSEDGEGPRSLPSATTHSVSRRSSDSSPPTLNLDFPARYGRLRKEGGFTGDSSTSNSRSGTRKDLQILTRHDATSRPEDQAGDGFGLCNVNGGRVTMFRAGRNFCAVLAAVKGMMD